MAVFESRGTSVPGLLLRGVRCRACGRPGVPEALPCPWCGERAPLSRETRRELLFGFAVAAACSAAAWCGALRAGAISGFQVVAAVAAGLILAPAAARCPAGAAAPSGAAGRRSGVAGAAAALAASCAAVARAFAATTPPGPSRVWFASALFAFLFLAALRFPALPPLSAPTARGRFSALAAGVAAAAVPLLSAAVPDAAVPEFGVVAFCALSGTAVSLSGAMALAAAVLAASFSPHPAAFALSFALATALFVAGGARPRPAEGARP